MSYMDFRNEAPTEVLNRACLSDGKTLLPYCMTIKYACRKAELLPTNPSRTASAFGPKNASNMFGIRKDRPLVVPEWCSTESVIVSATGRLLRSVLTLVKPDCIKWFAYEFQIVDDHFQGYDIPTDILISEKRVYYNENSGVGL